MLGIFDTSKEHPIVADARRVLFRARVHTTVISPTTLEPDYEFPLRGLLILRPESFPDLADFITRVRGRFPHLPLALFLRKSNAAGNLFLYRKLADFVYDDSVESERVISDLSRACEANGLGKERSIVGGLSLERGRECARIFGLPVLYTECEWMLLSYLLEISPRAASAEELAAMALRPATAAHAHTAVSHISKINRKTAEYLSGYRPIENTGDAGYRIRLR